MHIDLAKGLSGLTSFIEASMEYLRPDPNSMEKIIAALYFLFFNLMFKRLIFDEHLFDQVGFEA